MQASEDQRANSGRSGVAAIYANDKPMEGTCKREQITSQPFPGEESGWTDGGSDVHRAEDLVDIPRGGDGIADPDRSRQAPCKEDQLTGECHSASIGTITLRDGILGEDLRKVSREDGTWQDPIAPGHGGLDLEIRLDMGEEADDRDVSEVRVVFDLADRLNRPAAGGIQVNDEERRLFRQGPGDHLVLTSRERDRDAEMFRRLGDLGGEKEVIDRDQHVPVHRVTERARSAR